MNFGDRNVLSLLLSVNVRSVRRFLEGILLNKLGILSENSINGINIIKDSSPVISFIPII